MENTCEHFENCPSQCCGECPVGDQREPEPDVMVGNATVEEYREKVVEEEPCSDYPESCGECPFGKKEKPEKACTIGISRGVKTAREHFARFQTIHALQITLTNCYNNLKSVAQITATVCNEEAELPFIKEIVSNLKRAIDRESERLKYAARPLELGLLTVENIKEESRESVNE